MCRLVDKDRICVRYQEHQHIFGVIGVAVKQCLLPQCKLFFSWRLGETDIMSVSLRSYDELALS